MEKDHFTWWKKRIKAAGSMYDVVRISFDNLALKQLDVKSLLSEKEWNQFYMGDDGLEDEQTSASMFVDMVERKFAKNSCSKERFDLLPTVEEMYNKLI